MKKIYSMTLITMLFFTSNLFSQSLPYNVGVNGQDGAISIANGWTFKFEIGSPLQDASVLISEQPNGAVKYEQPYVGQPYLGSAVKEITSMGTVVNLDYFVSWSYVIGGGSTFKLYGSTDGLNWTIINSNINNNTTLSFTNSSNYTWVKIEFSGVNNMNLELNNFDLYDMTTGIKSNNISENYSVYSYDKNIVIKTNDSKEYKLIVYNLSGQEVLNKTIRGNNNFNLNISNGMYIVNVDDGTESYHQKVVIQ
ncbi:MAG: T9SS type A sorting domain-containing protein [Flavobacteriales bacterium]|nr:T9SS type A sorting domain-containing protein [Flavobacteriales bacterium]